MISPRPRRSMSQINVVPYIDVMLVLLIIFMVTAPFINPSQVELPSVGKSSKAPEAPIEVTVKRDGSLLLQDRGKSKAAESVTDASLERAIKRMLRDADQPVVISADKSVRYEKVMKVMSRLQRLGVARVGLLVKPSQQ